MLIACLQVVMRTLPGRMLLLFVSIAAVYATQDPGSTAAVNATQDPGSPAAVYATKDPGSPAAVYATQDPGSPAAVYATHDSGSPAAVYDVQGPDSHVPQHNAENSVSATEYLQRTTPQSINTDNDANTDTDTMVSVTESLPNTTSQSNKDAITDTDTKVLVTQSFHKYAGITYQNVRNPPSTNSSDTTTSIISTIPQEASGDNNTTHQSKKTVDDWMRHVTIHTRYVPTIEEEEAHAYNIIHNCSTCEHKCGLRKSQRPSECYCDKACVQLGDCCIDYEASCLSGPNVTSKNYADILSSRKPRAKSGQMCRNWTRWREQSNVIGCVVLRK
ncbi:hypothetical protein LSAT2_025275 [Lamellibrachia satsuma]|nr:hypothetical protein LSAT2_025275 [Lamellibrachia satsuma]